MSGKLVRYLLPALVFQSAVIGGGYGTGRELVEFFLSLGPRGGLFAIIASAAVFSAVSMVTFELARVWGAYDYGRFFRRLLGPGWWLFELCYLLLLLIVLAVIAAAAGSIADEAFGINRWVGVGLAVSPIALLVAGGSKPLERFFAGWSLALYAVYAVFVALCLREFGSEIGQAFADDEADGTGLASAWAGIRYAGYNLAVITPVLATIRFHRTRKETLVAGALTGPVAMVPGLLFFLAMAGAYPTILDATVPANELLEALGSRTFQVIFQLILFGTLIETGAALIHGLNERIAGSRAERGGKLPFPIRLRVAAVPLAAATALSGFGLTALIASGYGTLTLGFIAVYVVPVLTVGIWRLTAGVRPDRPSAQR